MFIIIIFLKKTAPPCSASFGPIALKCATHPSQQNIPFHKPAPRYLKRHIIKRLALGIQHSKEFKRIIKKPGPR